MLRPELDDLPCRECGAPVDPADAACCQTNQLCPEHAATCACWTCAAFRSECAAAEPLEEP